MTRAVQFAVEIAEAVACAHAEGIVHRDLKPQNIMVTKTGTKLLDFGLASFSPGSAGAGIRSTVLTRPGIMVGTVQDMAPEQVQGLEADAASDSFSLGLVVYEMLAGQRAFSPPTTVETLHAILHDEPPPLPDSIPAGLRTLVAHCLEKDRTLCFQTARDLVFALGALALAAASKPAPTAGSSRRWITAAAPAAALAAAALIVGTVIGTRVAAPDVSDLGQYSSSPSRWTPRPSPTSAWSPDGKSVAFVRTDAKGEPQIVVRSAGSEVTTALTERGLRAHARPFWSRDGTPDLLRQVAHPIGQRHGRRAVRTELPGRHVPPTLSPDGKTFAVWRTTVNGSRPTRDLVVVDRAAGRPARPVRARPVRGRREATSPEHRALLTRRLHHPALAGGQRVRGSGSCRIRRCPDRPRRGICPGMAWRRAVRAPPGCRTPGTS